MGEGFQFIDIIFFAMVAAFLVLRLRSVLGRRDGHEGPPPGAFGRSERPGKDARAPDDNVVQLPDNSTPPDADAMPDTGKGSDPLGIGVNQIRALDPNFNSQEFSSGARIAFELILNAYSNNDTRALKPLLSQEVYANFEQVILNRENAGQTLEDTLVGIKSADMVEAYTEGALVFVTVKFVSEQVNALIGADGEVVDGDPNAVTEVTDFWTFSRDTKSRDPNWVLVATRSLD